MSSRSSPSPGSSRRRSPASSTSLSARALRRFDPRAFLRGVVDTTRGELAPEISSFRSAVYSYMAQMWFGNPQLHYEVWIRSRIGVIELGLHFEADPLTNARLLAAFKARERRVRDELGDEAQVETWDKGWARIWESAPLGTLDGEFLERLASRMAAYITALEPILRDELPSDVAWSEPRGRSAQRVPTGVRAKQRR